MTSFLTRRIQAAIRTVPEITATELESRLRRLPEHRAEMSGLSSLQFAEQFESAKRVIRTNARVQAAPVIPSQTFWEEYAS